MICKKQGTQTRNDYNSKFGLRAHFCLFMSVTIATSTGTPEQKRCSLNMSWINKWMSCNLKSVVFFFWKIRTEVLTQWEFWLSIRHFPFCSFLSFMLFWTYINPSGQMESREMTIWQRDLHSIPWSFRVKFDCFNFTSLWAPSLKRL